MRSDRDTIRQLQSDPRIYGECPSCGEGFPVKSALLFYADDPLPAPAQSLLEERRKELDQGHQDLREQRKQARDRSERGAASVNLGKILEKMAPMFEGFQYEPRDCRALFEPIDYVVFRGLSGKGRVDALAFVEIKTGGAGLNDHQKQIRDAVQAGRVGWETYQIGGER
jgi:predicted Holliday junction resolvase-like endonuclease